MLSIITNKRTDVKTANEIGKCLEENEDIFLWDGRRVCVSDLVGKCFVVPSIKKNFKVVPAVAWAEENGTKPVTRILTQRGKQIIRSDNHRLWSAVGTFRSGKTPNIDVKGWTAVSKIKKGDLVAVPNYLLKDGGRIPTDDIDLVRLCAYMIGDGGVTAGSTFSQEDNETLADFRRIIGKYGCETAKAGDYTYRIRSIENNGPSSTNRVNEILRGWGLWKTRGDKKEVPEFIWQLPRK